MPSCFLAPWPLKCSWLVPSRQGKRLAHTGSVHCLKFVPKKMKKKPQWPNLHQTVLWEPCVFLLRARWAATGVPAIQALVTCDGGITPLGQSEPCTAPAKPRPPNLLPTFPQGFPGGAGGKELTCNAGCMRDAVGSIPGSERSPGEGDGNPLQSSYLENPKDRGAWQAIVHSHRVGHD